MIQGISHVGIWVLDQDAALDFYVGKLGFAVHTDARMDDYRWLTVTPPGQPELQLMLALPQPPAIGVEDAEKVKSLLAKGEAHMGILGTKDCRATYAELSAKGVEFGQEPTEAFYGVDVELRDPFGNCWRLVQQLDEPPTEFPAS